MKIKYIETYKSMDGKSIDVYYCKKLSYSIFVQNSEYPSIWRVRNDEKILDDSSVFDSVKFNSKNNYFKIKSEEITNNNIIYYITFKIDAEGNMFDIIIKIPNVIKFKLPLENYNVFGFNSNYELYDKSYFDVVREANNIVENLNSNKVKKIERRK